MPRKRESSFGFSCCAVAAALALACGEEEPEQQGELMVSMTTDMAVPTDINALVWSVTLSGELEPFATGTVNLSSGKDFPVTLAIVAGPQTTDPVTVRVEGRAGPDSDKLRVSREARLVIPTDRVATLHLPLAWLCSDANLTESCPDGTTCVAGACVDALVNTPTLPDFEPQTELECYDVPSCFFQSSEFASLGPWSVDPEAAPCAITSGSALGSDGNVNVALVVNNERVGNYGFCGPYKECLVPLPRSSEPGGWQFLKKGDSVAIRLPDAVCGSPGVTRAAVTRLNASCPTDRGERPLCAPPPDTCLVAPICPASSPSQSWVGYACSGATTPYDADPTLLNCWSPPVVDGEQPMPDNGRNCCLKGEPPAADPLVIDDMSGGPQLKRAAPEGHVTGWWFSSLAEGSGDLFPPPGNRALYTYRNFDPPLVTDGGPVISAAACLRSEGFASWIAMQGFFFGTEQGTFGQDFIDARPYSGVSFWARSFDPFEAATLSIDVLVPNTQTSREPGSECVTPEGDVSHCEDFYKTLELAHEFKQYFVRWEELHQSKDDWGQVRFDRFKKDIALIGFAVRGASLDDWSQPFDFCVADVRFTKD